MLFIICFKGRGPWDRATVGMNNGRKKGLTSAGVFNKSGSFDPKAAVLADRKKKKFFFNYDKNRDWAENFALVMQIGLTMAGCILFCFFIGLYLDRWLGTGGLFTIIGILLGIAGGGVTVYRQIGDMLKDKRKEHKDEDG